MSARCVRFRRSLGPIDSSRELSLPGPWSRNYGAHLLSQATEELCKPAATADHPAPTQLKLLPMTVTQAKRAMRQAALQRRQAISASKVDAVKNAAISAAGHFQTAIDISPTAVLAGYWPMRNEFDVRPLLRILHDRGHTCSLPVVVADNQPLTFREWHPETVLQSATFGAKAPPVDAPVVTPNVLLVPLLAFDDHGYRLGYGGGFFDRTLDYLRRFRMEVLAIGIAYAEQHVDAVPHQPYDQRLNWVVTEKGAQQTMRMTANVGERVTS